MYALTKQAAFKVIHIVENKVKPMFKAIFLLSGK